jgi:hypothetical protein
MQGKRQSPQNLVNGWPTEADHAGNLTDTLALSTELTDCFLFLFRQGDTPTGFAPAPSLSRRTGSSLTG